MAPLPFEYAYFTLKVNNEFVEEVNEFFQVLLISLVRHLQVFILLFEKFLVGRIKLLIKGNLLLT